MAFLVSVARRYSAMQGTDPQTTLRYAQAIDADEAISAVESLSWSQENSDHAEGKHHAESQRR